MSNQKFTWGQVIDRFTLDFDGQVMEVTKYHPPHSNDILYHCEELHAAYTSMFALTIAYIAYQQLGHNQNALVSGIARALDIKE